MTTRSLDIQCPFVSTGRIHRLCAFPRTGGCCEPQCVHTGTRRKQCRWRTHVRAYVRVFVREIGDVFVPDGFKKRQHRQYRLPNAL